MSVILVHLAEGRSVTARSCAGQGCRSYVAAGYSSDLCPECLPRLAPVVTTCGCTLEDAPCTMHRNGSDHRHCNTCGVPVFFDEEAVEYDDHKCPPGFALSAAELAAQES